MRLPKATIQDFQRIDSTVTAADAFCDSYVRDRVRKNHNALISGRLRRNILHLNYSHEESVGSWWHTYGIHPPNIAYGPYIFRQTIFVTQQTQSLKLYVRADKNTACVSHPKIYSHVHKQAVLRNFGSSVITVTAAPSTPTDYSVDLPLPAPDLVSQYFHGFLAYTLTMVIEPVIDPTPPTYSGVAVTAADGNWLTAAIGLSTVGQIIACDSDRTIEPRQIVRVDAGGRRWIERPWNKEFRIGTDTVEVLNKPCTPMIYSVSLYEQNVTDFYATPGAV